MIDGQIFRDIYLFKKITDEQCEAIAEIAVEKTFSPGDEIFCDGDEATALFIIQIGSVRITRKTSDENRVEVATLATGSHFGEMAFLDAEKRSADVTAIETTQLVEIGYEPLRKILENDPDLNQSFYVALARFLAGRLRITTSDLTYAREKNIRYF